MKKKRVYFLFIASISILVPAILGGLRTTDIGTDTSGYLLYDYNRIFLTDSFIAYYKALFLNREIIYLMVQYFVGSITNNINWVMFVLQLCTLIPIYIGVYRHKEKIDVDLFMLCYFFFYYNITYNLIRQSIGMSIIFMGMYAIEKRNYKKFLIYVIVAMGFHSTAALSLIYIPVHYLLCHSNGKYRKQIKMLMVSICGLSVLFFEQIIYLLVYCEIINSRYLGYVTKGTTTSNTIETCVYLLILFIIRFWVRKKNRSNDFYDFYEINLYISLITLQLNKVLYYGNRISLIFSMVNLILISHIPQLFKYKSNKKLVKYTLIAIYFIYWIYVFAINQTSATVPYQSIFNL